MTTNQTDQIAERKAYHQHLMDKLSIKAGDVETCTPQTDDDRQLYAKKLEKRFNTVKAVLDNFSQIAKSQEESIRIKLEEDMSALRKRSEAVKKRLSQLKEDGRNAGTELEKGISSAIEELAEGIKRAASKL